MAFVSSLPGSAAEYRCNIGYTLFGNAKISCLSDGDWEKPPICAPVTCPTPMPLPHGRVTYTSLTYGSSLSYTCDFGYSLLDIRGSPFNGGTVCREDGTWSTNSFPICQEINCPQLPRVVNGQLFKIEGYKIGNSAVYRCEDGYTLNGSSSVTCQSNGRWSEPPRCCARDCSIPNSIENGRMEFTSLKVGATAQFQCNNGYNLQGSSVLVCGPDGQWSGAMPICQCKCHLTLCLRKQNHTKLHITELQKGAKMR